MNKKTIFTILSAGTAFLPALSSAATLQGMADAAVDTTLYVASAIVVILWVLTGILFLTAQGDPGKLNSAKTALFTSIAGTALVIVAAGAIGLVKSMFRI